MAALASLTATSGNPANPIGFDKFQAEVGIPTASLTAVVPDSIDADVLLLLDPPSLDPLLTCSTSVVGLAPDTGTGETPDFTYVAVAPGDNTFAIRVTENFPAALRDAQQAQDAGIIAAEVTEGTTIEIVFSGIPTGFTITPLIAQQVEPQSAAASTLLFAAIPAAVEGDGDDIRIHLRPRPSWYPCH